jgi:Fic family protein
MLLGEARSKCEHIAGVPLRPEVAGELYKVYLSKGAYATTSIEGNTLSEEEVRRRLDGLLKLPSSQEYLGREVDNIIDACNQISRELKLDSPVELTPERIKQFNALVLRDLELEEGVVAGEYRTHSVGVMRYLGAPAEDIEFLVEQMCKWLNGPDFPPGDSPFQFTFAVIKAILAHLYIAWIHPFGDGNGRTARLIEFQLLVQSGMAPLPAGHLLSNHYNMTRTKYYRELDRASGSGGDIIPFANYAIEGFVDGLREQLSYVRAQQLEVTWENHVHRQFRGKDTQARSRRKHLVLDMPREAVTKADIRHISVRVAEEYHGKTDKTVTRDLNALVRMDLMRKVGRRYQANRGSILAFLPPQATR